MKKLYNVPKKKKRNSRPWDLPSPKGSLENTVFGQDYLTCVVDEAHKMRNEGNQHTAILLLLLRAKIRLPNTATPLQTSPKARAFSMDLCTVFFSLLFRSDRTSRLWLASLGSPTSSQKLPSLRRRMMRRPYVERRNSMTMGRLNWLHSFSP